MNLPEIEQSIEHLFRIAVAKCGNFHDAEDLTQEVLLAALQYPHQIRDIRAWLSTVLNHKYHDMLRKKYRLPTVSIDMVPQETEVFVQEIESDRPDATHIRREVAYLAEKYRQVIVRHYLGGESVDTIAKALDIPRGTVLSRLSYGREQMRKGLEMMESYETQSYRPERLDIGCHGTPGFHDEPWSLVAHDLMKQNILIVAYDAPLTAVEIAKALGIPTAYIENALHDLVSSELMRKIGNRYGTDFMIVTPEMLGRGVEAEIQAVEAHYAEITAHIHSFLRELREMALSPALAPYKQEKLAYYFLLHLFSGALYTATKKLVPAEEEFPPRPDGGQWIAIGTRYEQQETVGDHLFGEYTYGGERRAYREGFCNARTIGLHIYDTQPDLNRYEHGPVEMHDTDLASLLYIISRGIPFESTGFDPIFCQNIAHLTDCGVLATQNGRPVVDIPIITPEEYRALDQIRKRHMPAWVDMLMPILVDLFPKVKLEIPKHLEGRVAAFRQYSCYAMPMAWIKSATAKGDFPMAGNTPPMVLVVDDYNQTIR